MAQGTGITVVLLAAVVNANFALPMRFMPRWKFENTWLLYSVLALVIFPGVLALATISHLSAIIVEHRSTATAKLAL